MKKSALPIWVGDKFRDRSWQTSLACGFASFVIVDFNFLDARIAVFLRIWLVCS